MYPRNATSPEPVAIGPVIQISDGAVQTSGVTVRIKPVGVAEADGAGTTAYSTDGVVIYTPTQAETNYTSFVLIAKKTGCLPASQTVITSESTVSGRVYVGTNGDKTGYSLTQTFPANFASLGINSSGHISRVVLVDTTTVNSDMRGTDGAALATHWTSTRAGYLDGVLIAANFNQRTVQVTGSNHVAADIHELQAGVIQSTHFAPNAIDANAIAASAVTEIQSGLATAANQTTILARLGAFTGTGINTVLGFLRAMASKAASTPSDIAGTYSATTDSLEAIRDAQAAGTGDASQATLEAVQDTVDAIAAKVSGGLIEVTSRVATGGNITLYIGDDARVRSGTEIEVTISDVGGTIYSRLNALGVGNLAWGASRRGLNAGAISGTISGLSQSGSGATQALTFAIEINNAGDDLLPHDEYTWQIVSTSAAGDEWVEVEGALDLRRRVAVPV